MLEEIKKEIDNAGTYSIGDIEFQNKRITIKNAFEILDKYKDKEKTILYLGNGRNGKTLEMVKGWVNYITEHKLTECKIYVDELPNVYKNAWEELKRQTNKGGMPVNYLNMIMYEQKYNIGSDE